MPAWLAPAIMGAVQLGASIFGAHKQKQSNMELAEFQARKNEEYLRLQNEYNTPANQMARFGAAGLNPHLIYGQGNPGNQSAPVQYPGIKNVDYQTMYGTILPTIIQSKLAQSQVAVQEQKIRESGVDIQVKKMQERVLSANPLLNTDGFKAIIDGLKATAESKAASANMQTMTSDWFTGQKSFQTADGPIHGPAGVVRLEAELQLLEQKFNLGSLDSKLKAEVLTSKEFQNTILEVQKKFLADGDVGPQQIYQFIMLLLMKAL